MNFDGGQHLHMSKGSLGVIPLRVCASENVGRALFGFLLNQPQPRKNCYDPGFLPGLSISFLFPRMATNKCHDLGCRIFHHISPPTHPKHYQQKLISIGPSDAYHTPKGNHRHAKTGSILAHLRAQPLSWHHWN